MFDGDRHVIAYPWAAVNRKPRPRGAGQAVDGSGHIADPVFQAFLARKEALEEEQFPVVEGGQRYVAGYRQLKVSGGPTWFLGAYAPESDFLGVLTQNRRAAFAVAVAALCIGLLFTMILARRISVPLTRLASEMEEVGDFQLTVRPPMKTIFKEVATMDESLLNMKGSLRSFSYYVPRDLVRAMLESGQEATLQGQSREMTVYFSDIAGMTSIAETMPPDQLVQLLSRYFDEMTQVVAAQGGTVDKFIGDAIMAFWGAPGSHGGSRGASLRNGAQIAAQAGRAESRAGWFGTRRIFARASASPPETCWWATSARTIASTTRSWVTRESRVAPGRIEQAVRYRNIDQRSRVPASARDPSSRGRSAWFR